MNNLLLNIDDIVYIELFPDEVVTKYVAKRFLFDKTYYSNKGVELNTHEILYDNEKLYNVKYYKNEIVVTKKIHAILVMSNGAKIFKIFETKRDYLDFINKLTTLNSRLKEINDTFIKYK